MGGPSKVSSQKGQSRKSALGNTGKKKNKNNNNTSSAKTKRRERTIKKEISNADWEKQTIKRVYTGAPPTYNSINFIYNLAIYTMASRPHLLADYVRRP